MKRTYLLPLGALLILIGFGIAATLYLHDTPLAMLTPAGPVAAEERWVMLVTVALSAIVVVPVFVLLFYFAWKYRAGSTSAIVHHRPDWDHDNFLVEFLWWLVPAIIIFILGIVMWQTSHDLDPYKPLNSGAPALTVDVVALDWKWLFIYPEEGVASVNALELPAGTPVHFYLTADAPMNSFWIPALGGQIMVMPGMTTQLNLMADSAGTYNGASGNISGEGFAGMAFTATAVSPSEFSAWVAAAKAGGDPLDLPTYAALRAPSSYVPPRTYSAVDPALYSTIVMNYMSPHGTNASSTQMSGMDMQAP